MTMRSETGPVIHVVVAGEVGGAERMVLSLARAAAGGADGGSRTTGRRRHLIALWSDTPAVEALFSEGGVDVVSPPRRAGARLPSALSASASGGDDVAWLAALLQTSGAAAVQLHTFASHVLGTRAGLRAGVPVIRTEHSTRVYDHWLCRPFSSWSLRRAAAVVAVSDYLRREIAARAPAQAARVRVIHNGVPFPYSALAPPPTPGAGGPLRIALVARLEPRKGADRALQALAHAQVPAELQLDVVGDGPCRHALERQAAELGIADRVRFWGYRRDPETIIGQTHAVLCSSRTEGMGVALIEAMALARPVIAVPVGGVPEIVTDGETAWLSRDCTVAGLAGALTAAAHAGPAELARRGVRARASVAARFTAAQMCAAYEEVYQSLAGRRSAEGTGPATVTPAVVRSLG